MEIGKTRNEKACRIAPANQVGPCEAGHAPLSLRPKFIIIVEKNQPGFHSAAKNPRNSQKIHEFLCKFTKKQLCFRHRSQHPASEEACRTQEKFFLLCRKKLLQKTDRRAIIAIGNRKPFNHAVIRSLSVQGDAAGPMYMKEFFTMKKYEAPEVRVDTFAIEDVMTASTHFDIPEENPYE